MRACANVIIFGLLCAVALARPPQDDEQDQQSVMGEFTLVLTLNEMNSLQQRERNILQVLSLIVLVFRRSV